MKTVTIKGGGYEAVILPEFGANCIALTHGASRASLLRSPETEEAFLAAPNLYGMPLLFPPNRIQDGRFTFEGRTYTFPVNEPERQVHLHGELYQTAFALEAQSEESVVLTYRATEEEPYLAFPHAFCVRIAYRLDASGLEQTVTVANESGETMPVGLGFHTAFPLLFLQGSRGEDIRLQGELGPEYGRDPDRLLTVWDPLPESETHQAIENGTFCPCGGVSAQYRCGESRVMRIMDAVSGSAIVYEVSDTYASWLTWRPQGSDFLCLEPQSWLVNAPYAPDPAVAGLKSVAPGESISFSAKLCLSQTD